MVATIYSGIFFSKGYSVEIMGCDRGLVVFAVQREWGSK